MKKKRTTRLCHQQTLSILMACVNGFNSAAPLLPPIAAVLGEAPLPRRETVDDYFTTSFSRTGQVLDRLLFTTAYAYTPTVNGGSSVTGETITGGGTQDVNGGTVTSTTIADGGVQNVSSGTVTATTVLNGGTQVVTAVTDASYNILARPSVSTTTVEGGGTLYMANPVTITATTVKSGGILNIYGINGGGATGTILSAGYVLLADTNNTLTTVDGSVTIQNGTATNVQVNNGGLLEVVDPSHQAVSTTVNAGGTVNVYCGTATSTTVNSGGRITIFELPIVDSNTGITLYTAFGTATSTTVNGGSMIVSAGGIASATTINAGGTQEVYGSASNTSITNSGTQNIKNGGTASSTTVTNGGVQNVSGGAVAFATTISSGGTQNVLNGGTASSTTVTNGGLQYVYSGGTATGTSVSSGGLMNIESGAAIAGATTLSGGTAALIGNSGSYAIASLTATGGGTVKLASGTTTGRNLTINSLSGSANFVINTDLANGKADTITVNGGTSHNTLQVFYDPAYLTGKSATGSATFATVSGGGAIFTAAATEYGAYRYTPVITSVTSGTTTTWAVTKLAAASGASASETVHTASDVIAGNLLAWRTENNNLTKRLGELRATSGEAGMWLRTYRGAEEIANGDGRTTKQQYTALQGGYDNKISRDDGVLFTGFAAGYLEGSSTYSRGNSDGTSFSTGAYGSWLGNKGHFIDVIAKVGKLRNNYASYLNDPSNTRVNGSYANWGASLSAEYGYRKQLENNWYLEPQAELTYSRVNGADYTASDGTSVHNDAVNSFTGRLGLAVGRHVGSTHYYGKVSLAGEFAACSTLSASTGTLSPVAFQQDLKESWLEFALGLATKLDKRVDGYLEITRTTGDKARTPWQVNVGARWNF
ncbi:MAG: autotransporter outer membrane beta-barrel domain-containing protein [Negativicutes bacterium]|nr:autotransporter outer membrane beta-barrel domain-containing protein [Negativicutes bacterium]